MCSWERSSPCLLIMDAATAQPRCDTSRSGKNSPVIGLLYGIHLESISKSTQSRSSSFSSHKTSFVYWTPRILTVRSTAKSSGSHGQRWWATHSIWSTINITCCWRQATAWNVRHLGHLLTFRIRKNVSTKTRFIFVWTANSVGYHGTERVASSTPNNLADVANLGGSSKLFLRLHGAFMLIAWIGTASIGILLARYYKQTWVGSQVCGKDQWFAVSYTG